MHVRPAVTRTLVLPLALAVALVLLLAPVSTPPASAAPDNFTPRSGPTFNNPLGTKAKKRAIFTKVMRSINSTRSGSEIHIFSWNFLTSEGATALLRAQRRGVRVRVLMDDRNVEVIDNPPFRKLRRGLRNNNDGLRGRDRSWARLCKGSCRGQTGSAHSKFFLFSKVGKARKVVIQGSANFTLASTNNQWNDVFTHVGHTGIYDFMMDVFDEAALDKKAPRPYKEKKFGRVSMIAFPAQGKGSRDPIMATLRRVKCFGARNTGSGRTVIRIAPDVIRQARGERLAKKVRALWDNGCDVRIGYTVVGIKLGRMLREDRGRGPVPMRHLVQDFDNDGDFDNYFHLKSMTIRGHYGNKRKANVLINGSANWSGLARVSDENLGIYTGAGRVRRYQKHIDYWYENFPGDGSARTSVRGSAATEEEPQLVFGYGKDAVYEDGEPVSDGTFDPFANISLD